MLTLISLTGEYRRQPQLIDINMIQSQGGGGPEEEEAIGFMLMEWITMPNLIKLLFHQYLIVNFRLSIIVQIALMQHAIVDENQEWEEIYCTDGEILQTIIQVDLRWFQPLFMM